MKTIDLNEISPYAKEEDELRHAIWKWANDEHGVILLDGQIDDFMAYIDDAGWKFELKKVDKEIK